MFPFAFKVIRSWLNLPTGGHGNVICMGDDYILEEIQNLIGLPVIVMDSKGHMIEDAQQREMHIAY